MGVKSKTIQRGALGILFLLSLFLFVSCVGSLQHPARAKDGFVYIHSTPPAASLWINDRFVGQVHDFKQGIAIEPGPYRFEIRAKGYFTHYQRVDVVSEKKTRLSVVLAKILP